MSYVLDIKVANILGFTVSWSIGFYMVHTKPLVFMPLLSLFSCVHFSAEHSVLGYMILTKELLKLGYRSHFDT